MEVQVNNCTVVEVESRMTIVNHLPKNPKHGKKIKMRNDKIVGAEMRFKRAFALKRFGIVFALGLLGALAHYLYDTQFLGYVANPTLMSAIGGGIIFIGLFFCFPKNKQVFKILINVYEGGLSAKFRNKHIELVVDESADSNKLEDLMYLLAT